MREEPGVVSSKTNPLTSEARGAGGGRKLQEAIDALVSSPQLT